MTMIQNLVPPIIVVVRPATERTLPKQQLQGTNPGKKRIEQIIQEAPMYWPIKVTPRDSLETPAMNNQTTDHIDIISPNCRTPPSKRQLWAVLPWIV